FEHLIKSSSEFEETIRKSQLIITFSKYVLDSIFPSKLKSEVFTYPIQTIEERQQVHCPHLLKTLVTSFCLYPKCQWQHHQTTRLLLLPSTSSCQKISLHSDTISNSFVWVDDFWGESHTIILFDSFY
ncbi:Hypothetical protein EIN_511070, partial [Entamoeba invadens IP1]